MPDPITLFFGKRLAGRFEFSSEDAHHMCHVLRNGVGDRIWAINGSGTAFEVELDQVEARKAYGVICSELPDFNEPACEIILMQGLIQQSKMDWLVEKATELGTTEIRPVCSKAKVGPGRMRRWERLARSATKQCLRGLIPAVHEPQDLNTALADLPADSQRFLLDPGGQAGYVIDPANAGPIVLAVGPEKGFTDDQLDTFGEAGFLRITLGIRRLRAETAAIAALSMLQPHLLGRR